MSDQSEQFVGKQFPIKFDMSLPILNQKRGFLIVIEGMDAVGKTENTKLLQQALELTGFKTKIVRAPGGCEISDQIRNIVKNPKYTNMTEETELLLVSASFAQTVNEVIKPALANGEVVICDRYYQSTIAFQGARGINMDFIKASIQFSIGGALPDVSFILYAPEEVAKQRIKERAGKTDRFESENAEYLKKVYENYDLLRKLEPQSKGRIIGIDASLSLKEVHNEIYRCVVARISALRTGQLEVNAKLIV